MYTLSGWILPATNQPRIKIDLPADMTAPAWTAGPATTDITPTSFTLSTTLNETGSIYWVLLADGAEAPSAAAIVTGTAGTRGNFSASAGTAVTSDPIPVTAGTAYDVYLVAVDTAGNQSTRIKIDLPADRTAPAWTARPAATDTDYTLTRFRLRATLNEAGRIYWVVLADGAEAPDPAAIIAATAGTRGNFLASADTVVMSDRITVTAGTAYDVYLVAADTAGNQSTRIKIDLPADRIVLTLTAAVVSLAPLDFTLQATLNKDGRIYWVVLADGAEAPSAASIVDGTAGSSSVEAMANTQVLRSIAGLTANTAHDVYLVGVDTAGDQSRIKIDVPADRTPPTWTAGPAITDITPTSFKLSATLNEDGKIYWELLADNALAPDPFAIFLGLVGTVGNFPASAGTPVTSDPISVTAGTAYDVYVIAEDTVTPPNQLASLLKIDVPADRTPPRWETDPAQGSVSSNAVTIINAELNEAGTIYYVVLPVSAPAPNAAAIIGAMSGTRGSRICKPIRQ